MKADLLTAAWVAEVNLLSLMELEFSLGFYNRIGIVQLNQKVFQGSCLGLEPEFHFHSVVVLCVEALNEVLNFILYDHHPVQTQDSTAIL